ncbi:MAG TPA: TraR/DksA C4-type zinc finger protein [Acidimicrobiales bacterium]|nr:TraR/DksA C4-type zinc finger protein [Acidimicrobiales bacterium]
MATSKAAGKKAATKAATAAKAATKSPAAKTSTLPKKAAPPPKRQATPAADKTAKRHGTTAASTKAAKIAKATKKSGETPRKHTAAAKPSPSAGAKKPTDADGRFLAEQRELLLAERRQYEEQAAALKAEADQLAAEAEGESEFTEEGGDVDSMSAERERDLALASQARQNIEEIDRALEKIAHGTYGFCERCGQPIVRARLKALPFAALCVACKSGGLSARR